MATINGTSGNDTLNGTSGDDTLNGLGGNDELFGSAGNDFYDGGTGNGDTLNLKFTSTPTVVDFSAGTISGGFTGTFVNMEYAISGDGNDHLIGTAGVQNLSARAGNDTLEGGAGNDSLWGGGGNDTFLFHEAGTGNADKFFDFTSGSDKIAFDGTALSALGAEGNFAAGDARFAANTSGTAQDSSDRIIYETDTRQVWYDPDGTGAAARQLIGTLQSGATLAATDIVVQGGGGGGTPPGTINGTEGDDTLTGTPGNDTINGLGGNDSISGLAGDDSLSGGDGNDTLDGGPGVDTLDGGLGDDVYFNPEPGDIVTDAGGIDTLIVFTMEGRTGPGIENLTLRGGPFPIPGEDDYVSSGTGNELNNLIISERSGANGLFGLGGDDTLIGGPGGDYFVYDGSGLGHDTVDGGGGFNTLDFTRLATPVVVDFQNGTATSTSATVSFVNMQQVFGTTGGDQMLGSDAAVRFWGNEGNDTLVGGTGNDLLYGDDFHTGNGAAVGDDSLSGGAGDDQLVGGAGNDVMEGGSGNDTLVASSLTAGAAEDAGNDTVNGGSGNDTLEGGGGADQFIFDQAPGTANADHIRDFASGSDKIHLDATVMTALGASGAFSAGDARFYEAAGASAGHDSDDRVVYDTASGNLWYDADGNGGQAAQLIAILDGRAALAATDIVVDNGSGGTGGQHLVGTAGNDSIVGTEGNDTIEGRDGFDTLVGADGNDLLAGGGGWDTMTGGAGDDSFAFTNYGKGMNDRVTDFVSGSDVIQLDPSIFAAIGGSGAFSAGDGRFYAAPGASAGHDADDRIIYDTSSGALYYDPDGNGRASQANIATLQGAPTLAATDILVQSTGMSGGGAHLVGGGGNDSLVGSGGADTIEGFGGNDTLAGGAGDDMFVFHEAGSGNADSVVDFAPGSDTLALDNAALAALGAEGDFASGDARFYAAAGASGGHDASDRVIYNTTTGQVWYDDDGSGAHAAQIVATLQGVPSLAATDITVI